MLSLPEYELSLFERMVIIWIFILCGFVLAFQAAQQYVEPPEPRWRLTAETKPYWYTFYVLEAFLLVQITYRVLMLNIGGLLGGVEEQLLNGLWMGLLGLECLMVAGLALRSLTRAVTARPKVPSKEL